MVPHKRNTFPICTQKSESIGTYFSLKYCLAFDTSLSNNRCQLFNRVLIYCNKDYLTYPYLNLAKFVKLDKKIKC